jgi:uncharacterized membrane protein
MTMSIRWGKGVIKQIEQKMFNWISVEVYFANVNNRNELLFIVKDQ